MSVKELMQTISEAGFNVHYYTAPHGVKMPYVVVGDYAENYDYADDRYNNIITSVQVDYYTKTACDTDADTLRDILSELGSISDKLLFYLDDEKCYHHVYDCEIT